jgi:RNA polymerase sigma-70 factor (ECF subfamily)
LAGDALASRREFEALLEPVLDPLFGTALRMTRNRSDAEDVVQESVMKAWRSFDRFQTGTNFKAWVFKILANTFVSGKRAEKRRPQPASLPDGGAAVAAGAPGDSYDAAEWNRIYSSLVDDDLKRALDELPDEFRVPLLLSTLGELSYKEMAASLEVPVGTIMSRLFRARERLREALKGYAFGRGIQPAPAREGR